MSSWGFRVLGYAFHEFGVSGKGFLVIYSGTGCTVQGFKYGVSRLGVSATRFRDSEFCRFGVSSTAFRLRGFWYVVS